MVAKGCGTSRPDGRTIGVLVSGRGSNLQALIDAIGAGRLNAHIAVVISNKPGVEGLDRARAAGIETLTINHRDYALRTAFDAALAAALTARGVELVCLAGFMRLIGQPMLDAFPQKIINIHPSLLPAFPGVDAQAQALAYGVKVSGVTVHLVTAELDGGPIILQAPVAVRDDDTAETLSARILEQEHRLYPEAVARLLDGTWQLVGRRFLRTPDAT